VKYTSWRKLGLFNEMPDPMVTAASARETIGVVSGGTVRASGNCGKVSGYVESAPQTRSRFGVRSRSDLGPDRGLTPKSREKTGTLE
jgi:hypothetical protein